jgi:hypothetical protein
MTVFNRLFPWVLSVVLAGLMGTSEAANNTRNNDGRTKYSGASMKCIVANDFYAVHFSAMQVGRQGGEASDYLKYCQEVPAIGLTFLTMDLLDRDVRQLPILLKVVQEELDANGNPQTQKILSEVPARIYKNGTADTKYDFAQPGHYALIAEFGEPGDLVTEDDRLRIPFTVALIGSTPTPWLKVFFWAALATLILASGWFGWMFYRRYWPNLFRGSISSKEV